MEVNVKKFAAMFDKIPSRLVFPGGHLEAKLRKRFANRTIAGPQTGTSAAVGKFTCHFSAEIYRVHRRLRDSVISASLRIGFRGLNSSAYQAGALFITWDEAGTGDGPIGMIVLSPFAKGNGYYNSLYYDHSSTLRSFEEIFGVSPFLGDAANETDLRDLFAKFP